MSNYIRTLAAADILAAEEEHKKEQQVHCDEVYELRKKVSEQNEMILSLQHGANVTEEILKNDKDFLKVLYLYFKNYFLNGYVVMISMFIYNIGLHEWVVFKAIFDLITPFLPDCEKLSHFHMIVFLCKFVLI